MRVLVIGAGSIGRRHAANLATLGAEAVLLPWRETSAEDVVARLGSFDAAVIATATDIRLPLIAACGAAGVPLYCEKPLAFRLSDLDAIAQAAAPVADRSAVGFMMRYHAGFRRLAEADLSTAFRFAFAIGHDVTQWRANWRFSDSYAARAEGGGVLLDLCHEIDMAACLLPALTLVASGSLGHADYPGVDVASHLTLRAANGALGSVAMDYLAPTLIRHARIDTLGGPVQMDFAAGRFDGEPVAQDRNAMFLSLMQDFLTHAQGHPVTTPFFPTFDTVQASCRLIAAAWEARRFHGHTQKVIP